MTRYFAKFTDPENAAAAAGALLDHGLKENELSLIGDEKLRDRIRGITTTTPGDAAQGAAEGGVAGLAVGALAGLISIFIPGYGLVVGSGALATAVAAAIGTGAAGIVTGGVIGYLKDLGVAEPVARDFADVIKDQGALLTLETDELEEAAVMGLLHKYGASRIEFFKVEVHA